MAAEFTVLRAHHGAWLEAKRVRDRAATVLAAAWDALEAGDKPAVDPNVARRRVFAAQELVDEADRRWRHEWERLGKPLGW